MRAFKTSTLIYIILCLFSGLQAQTGWFEQNSGTKEMLNSVYFVDMNTGWVAGGSDICFTRNGGADWTHQYYPIGTNEEIYFHSVYFVDALTGFVTGTVSALPHYSNRNLILKTTNGGMDWRRLQCCGGTELFSIHFEDALTGWAAGDDYIIVTSDGGETWAPQALPCPLNDSYKFTSVYFINKQTGWVAGKLTSAPGQIMYNVIFHTTNGGQYWTKNIALEGEGFNSVYFENTNNGWAVSKDVIISTVDGGKTWQNQDYPWGENDYYNFKSVHFSNSQTGWITGELFKDPPQVLYSIVMKTTNGGSNWNLDYINSGIGLNSIHFEDAQTGWTVGKEGIIYKTTNGGMSFDDRVNTASKQKSTLSQNYPNPFNPVTKISFSISKNTFVSLKVYDMAGREVKSLVNETKSPGNYSVDFNGSELTSGTYFYRIQADNYTDVKKMILIK